MIDPARLQAAYEKARADLLAERTAAGHWEGHLSSSALSTATAISALSIARSAAAGQTPRTTGPDDSQLIERGIAYLRQQQNEDGGWGDTDKSHSNIATTMLVVAAFHLAGHARPLPQPLERARAYLDHQGGTDGLRARYGRDKTFAVPILTNCALAGLVAWSQVAPLPFEWACLPQTVLSLGATAGRQLRHSRAGGDRDRHASFTADRASRSRVWCVVRRSRPACESSSGCSRTAAAIWKPCR